MPRATIEIKQDAASLYYFVLFIPKHDVGFTSRRFKTEQAAREGVHALRTSAAYGHVYERIVSPRKELYFSLHALDAQILGTSAMFLSEAKREQAIRVMKRYARLAEFIDPS